MPCHLKTSLSFQQTDSRSKYSPYLDAVPTNFTQGCLSDISGRVGEFFLCDFRCQATSLPFTFPSIGHVTRTESAEHVQRGSKNSPFSYGISFFISCSSAYDFLISLCPLVCFQYHLSIRQLALSPPHILLLCRECLLLVATKTTFVGSMISLAMTIQSRGPSTSHWNSTPEVLLTGSHT